MREWGWKSMRRVRGINGRGRVCGLAGMRGGEGQLNRLTMFGA